MTMIQLQSAVTSAASTRLAGLAPLDDAGFAALQKAERNARRLQARREIISEGQRFAEATILLSGWACRTHVLKDGRRQILGFILPGDLIGMNWHPRAVVPYNVFALTEIVVCQAPPLGTGADLDEAYALSKAWDDAYTWRHITRLGRLSAYERIADLILELFERLQSAGLTVGNRFQMPLTQEILADALGLTTVHVNRTMQALRQSGLLSVEARSAFIADRDALMSLLDRRTMAVQSQ